MPPLPPLNFTGGAAYGGTSGGPSPWNQGAWTVNVAGSAPSLLSAAGSVSPLLIAAALGVAWLLLK